MPLLIIFLIVILILAGAGYYFARVVLYPKVFPSAETFQRCVEWGHIVEDEYHKWPSQEVRIASPFGYELFAIYHPVQGSQKTVVLTHGITWSCYGMVKYAQMFYKRGFNILIYDLRNHGRSGGNNTTYGFYEKEDLKAVVDWAFSCLKEGGIVGTMGESLGAATTLQHAGIDPRISFAIADCSFSEFSELLAFRLKADYHLPPFPLINFANLWVKLLTGMTFSKASPIRYIPKIETPIFFVHGKNDSYIPPKMSIDMYRMKTKGHRKLYLAPNAGHAESYWNNQTEYDQQVEEFLQEIGL